VDIECDLLVIGAGMAGLSAAGWAAAAGAKVIVVERAGEIGGSAALSGGVLWTATSPGRMQLHGGGDPALGDVILDLYPVALDWLRERDVDVGPTMASLHGLGHQIDIAAHLQGCVSLVEQHGGHVVLETATTTLLTNELGEVVGAQTSHADGDVTIGARAVLLATGGYQNDPELRARYIHPNAREHLLLRTNLLSDGAGLRLAEAVGGHVPGTNGGFYGHLVTDSPRWGAPGLFTTLSQYHSDYTLLLNEQGFRFCDESRGDHSNTVETIRQSHGRALCFWDARIHSEQATRSIVAFEPGVDRFAVAMEHGAKGVQASTLEQIAQFAGDCGFDRTQVMSSITDYNQKARLAWEELNPRRAEHWEPLDQAPFYALVVHPAITFTYGGVTIDTRARVLDAKGKPISGLFAAGADAGAAYGSGYAGGLALAMTFGIRAAMSAGWRQLEHAVADAV
jgi:succinate dehydrogenase/fumarate reductase flavoprotein subunit